MTSLDPKYFPQSPHDHFSHGHSCDHKHGKTGNNLGKMWQAFFLNAIFCLIELIGGVMVNSVAIVSDALHDLGDALSILISIYLEKYSLRGADAKYSYGYRRFSTLAALLSGILIVVGSVVVLTQAIPRIMDPVQPNVNGMLILSLLGVLVNAWAALGIFSSNSLNEKMLSWHLIEDVMGWFAVFCGALVMKFWNIPRVDSILACMISIWVAFNVLKRLHESIGIFLQAKPLRVPLEKMLHKMRQVLYVEDIHHIHLWSLDGQKHIFTCHAVVKAGLTPLQIEEVKSNLKSIAKDFEIFESTLELEFSGSLCSEPSHVT